MNLYHYTSGQGLFGILNSGQLYCTNMKFLNDPSEGSYYTEIIKFGVEGSIKVAEIYQRLYNQSFFKLIHNPDGMYVASFSKNGDSLSMWNYYAQGNGYNIELDFKVDKICESNKDYGLSFQIVDLVYNKERQIQLLQDYILSKEEDFEEFQNLLDKENDYEYCFRQANIEQQFNLDLISLLLSFKHPAYEREEEVRLVITKSDIIASEKSNVDYRVSPTGVFVDFLKLDMGLRNSLKSVTVHPSNQGTLTSEGVGKYIASRFQDVEIRQSEIPFRVV